MAAQTDDAGNVGINADVHCHIFNATDIPVDGFVHHVALHDGLMSGPLADLAARLVSGAPGFNQDQARLPKRYHDVGVAPPSWLGSGVG
jgi:hypothetical protein